MKAQEKLEDVVAGAWRCYEQAADLESRVAPAIPILFFGDVDAYFASPMRALTVGLNPSLVEFPTNNPFERFPLAEGITTQDRYGYLKALSAYFHTSPYRSWFRHFEPLLNGLGASYYPGEPSTVLHTDICSPVATDPTWSRLDDAERKLLESDGGPLWHDLLRALHPQVVVISVARGHLSRIEFDSLNEWGDLHIFDQKANGDARKPPYLVRARRYMVGGTPSLFVFCPASRSPIAIGNDQKRELGATILEALANDQ